MFGLSQRLGAGAGAGAGPVPAEALDEGVAAVPSLVRRLRQGGAMLGHAFEAGPFAPRVRLARAASLLG